MQIRVFKKSVYILLSTTFFAQKPNNENKLPLKIKDTELAMCVLVVKIDENLLTKKL